MKDIKKDKIGIIGILFGLVFAGVGIGFLVLSIIPTLYDWQRMQSWQAVQAELLEAKLIANHSSDGTTHKATATYRYGVNGLSYIGERTAINDGSADNVGDFQKKLGRQLEAAYRRGKPINIWVDPDSPQDSVINRELRWGLLAFKLLFVVLFGGIGLAILFYSGKPKDDESWENSEFKDTPWLAESKWRSGKILSEARDSSIGLWVIAILWNLVSSPVLFFVPEEVQGGNYPALIAFIFPVAGVWLLFSAIRQSVRWRHFGPSPFQMRPFPARLGETVAGDIDIKLAFDPDTQFEVSLSCLYSYISGSGDDRTRKERVLWQDKKTIKSQTGVSGTRLSIDFAVPSDLPASQKESEAYNKWVLHVEAELQGPDYDRQFVIPVFAREGETAVAAAVAREASQDSTKEVSLSRTDVESVEQVLGMVHKQDVSHWHYPVWRSPGLSIGLTVFGAICLGSGGFIGSTTIREVNFDSLFDAGFGIFFSGMGVLMMVVFGLVGLLLVLLGIYVGANSLTLELQPGHLFSRRRLFGIPLRTRLLPFASIKRIDKKITSTTSNGSKHIVNYEVFAHTGDRTKYTLAEKLQSASDAEQVVSYFKKRLKLE